MFGIPEWAVGVGAICVVCLLTVPLAAWLFPKGMRPDGTGSKTRLAEDTERVAELERRVGELEAKQQRVAELEERLDFAERLLAQQRDAPRVGPAKT
jgi:hypothetical protein